MKPTHDRFDPGARIVPPDWISSRPGRGARAHGAHEHEPYRWMTTLPAPLAEARRCALQAFTEASATLAYLYETEEKVVIRCTLPRRQVRTELKPMDGQSTRIVVVTMEGSGFDRRTSGRLLDAIEHKLQDAGFPRSA